MRRKEKIETYGIARIVRIVDYSLYAIIRTNLLLNLFFLSSSLMYAQNLLEEFVYDSKTNEPVRWANIQILETKGGTTSDGNGNFKLHVELQTVTLKISAIGYVSKKIRLQFPGERRLVLKLEAAELLMSEMIVTPSDSVAVAIIRKSIEAKKK